MGDGGADIAAVEQVASRRPPGPRHGAGIRLLAVEGRRRIGREQIGIARDEVVAAVAPVDVGMEREIARAGVEQRAAFDAAVDRGGGAQELGCQPPGGAANGMRLLVASTTPPTACEPKRSASGPR